MGVLRKLGIVILVYVVLGIIFTFLLLNDIVSIHDGNILVNILNLIFQPIIPVANLLYYMLPI